MKFGDNPKFFNAVKYRDTTVVKLLYNLVFEEGSWLSRKELLQFEELGLCKDELILPRSSCLRCLFLSLDHSAETAELATRLINTLNVFDSIYSENLTENEKTKKGIRKKNLMRRSRRMQPTVRVQPTAQVT